MVDTRYRRQYETRYESNTVTDPDNGDTLLTTDTPTGASTDLADEGQVTTLRFYSANAGSISITVTTVDNEGNPQDTSTKFNVSGATEVDTGDFENPVCEVGAQSVISVNATSGITGAVSVNLRIDERTG